MMGFISGLFLLCILIVVHEFGHFIVAKLMGVKVLTFSVGFGPKIFGFKRGDTEYMLSAIPLGGYVRMYGDNFAEEIPDESKKKSFLHQKIWRKSLIALAGPAFNLILPLFLLFFIFIGKEQVLEPVVGSLLPNGIAAQQGLLPGDRVLAIDDKPVASFNDLVSTVTNSPNKPLKFDIERSNETDKSKQRLSLTVTPAEEPNPEPYKKNSVGRIGVMPAIQIPRVSVISPLSSAAQAGIATSDEIVSINDYPISNASKLFPMLQELKGKDITVTVKKKTSGEIKNIAIPSKVDTFDVPLQRQIFRYQIEATDLESESVKNMLKTSAILHARFQEQTRNNRGLAAGDMIVSEVALDSPAQQVGIKTGDVIVAIDGEMIDSFSKIDFFSGEKAEQPHVFLIAGNGVAWLVVARLPARSPTDMTSGPFSPLGITTEDSFMPGTKFERDVGVGEAITRSFTKTGELVNLTVLSLKMFVNREVPVSELGGPIMIFGVAGQAATQGLAYYIFVMCLISVNLGLLNLLPIPVLDGGHLLMFAIEGVQRKPLSIRTRQIATKIGLAFLLALMAIALFNDIARMFS